VAIGDKVSATTTVLAELANANSGVVTSSQA